MIQTVLLLTGRGGLAQRLVHKRDQRRTMTSKKQKARNVSDCLFCMICSVISVISVLISAGYYIYYEATEANNERTTLSSPMFNRSSFMCTFSFAYHMYGLDIGYLNVALYSVGSQQRTVLWTRSGVQGNAWHRVHVVVGSNNEWFQMELSTAALGLKGDVALDGLTFTNCNPGTLPFIVAYRTGMLLSEMHPFGLLC